MKNFWGKHSLLMVILVYISVLFAAVYFLAVPMIEKIESASDQIQEKIIDRQILGMQLEKLSDMEENWLAVEAQKASALEVILNPENELDFIENIESIAIKTGNTISLEIGDTLDAAEIEKIKKSKKTKDAQKGIMDEVTYSSYFPVKINLKGNYQGLVDFIHLIENSRFYVNVISIETQKEEIETLSDEKNVFLQKEKNEKIPDKKEIINTNLNAIVYTKN